MVATGLGVCAVSALLARSLLPSLSSPWWELMTVLAIYLVLEAFRRYIPAVCPQRNCGGAAYQKGWAPVRYECAKCRHVHLTEMDFSSTG